MPSSSRGLRKDLDLEKFARPQGAPRGLLLHYILCKISAKPTHGYELLQEIEEKTEGAWRPGPGSIYPMLKKLVSEGYIKAESPKNTETGQHSYRITPKGVEHLVKTREIFSAMSQKWGALRRIFIDMLDSKDLTKFFVEGSRITFDTAREALDARLSELPRSEAEYILKEYALNLQRQLSWTEETLANLQSEMNEAGASVVKSRQRTERIASK